MVAGKTAPLEHWRQGDIVLSKVDLPFIGEVNGSLGVRFVNAAHGIAILSQTCEIVRSIDDCPHVQIAPLQPVDQAELEAILRHERPRLVTVPAASEIGLAIDLDNCTTIEKGIVAAWDRTCGCPSDDDQRRIGEALSRHRSRFAFPDEFNREIAGPLKTWFRGKHRKSSPLGQMVQSIREVRVTVDDWAKPNQIDVFLLFDGTLPMPLPIEWGNALDTLEKRAAKTMTYPEPEIHLRTYDDFSARDYLLSDKLDWDAVSPD